MPDVLFEVGGEYSQFIDDVMSNLMQSLQGRDLGHLRIIAKFWGVELNAPDVRVGLLRLLPFLLSHELVEEVFETLPQEAQQALHDLLENQGRMAWSLFTRRYGVIREMGKARRDREHPYIDENATVSEVLWYRGLIAHNFFDGPDGPEEFVYIPDDLLPLLPHKEGTTLPTLGCLANPAETATVYLADDLILDDTCTLLAVLRKGLTISPHLSSESDIEFFGYCKVPLMVMKLLLVTSGLLDANGRPMPEAMKNFLEASRGNALLFLMKAWLDSKEFNELRLLPGLIAEGEWQNDPLRARRAILDFLSATPKDLTSPGDPNKRPFCSLSAFVTAIQQAYPDFQRPSGDYDSWYLRDQRSGEYLRGFEHWDQVDGALIRFIITGPLHWLGVLDLAFPEIGGKATGFRFSLWAEDLLRLKVPQGLGIEREKILVSSDGHLRASRSVPRVVRYQVARFCHLESFLHNIYSYYLTPRSLNAAQQQGLRVNHLLTLLRQHAKNVPPTLVEALKRWEDRGSEVGISQMMVLRLKDPQLLQELMRSRAARYLGELLGPQAVVVKPGAQKKVMAILVEMGYLSEMDDSEI